LTIEVAEIIGAIVSGEVTTAIVVTLHELFVVILSEAFVIVAVKVRASQSVAARGIIGT
jgi:hypothetical protein